MYQETAHLTSNVQPHLPFTVLPSLPYTIRDVLPQYVYSASAVSECLYSPKMERGKMAN